jgi:integrase
MRKRLSPRTIKALKPGKDGIRHGDVVMDDIAPNFGVRVLGTSDKPTYSFVLVTRFPGAANPIRAALAPFIFDARDERVAAESLKKARSKARAWLNSIEEGRDPRIEEARQREAEIRKANSTFAAVAEEFISKRLSAERRGKDVENDIRREFIPRWKALPVSAITDDDIIAVVRNKAKGGAPAQARNLLGHAQRLFGWVQDRRREYGLEGWVSPASGIRASKIDEIGKKIPRSIRLDDSELFAFWRSVSRLPYPAGPTYQLLLLSGLRLNEVAEASWSEFHAALVRALRQRGDAPIDWSKFDRRQLTWVIPAARMKGKHDTAREHAVPLTPAMLAILERLPQFVGGGYLFSHNSGRKPAVMSSDTKANLDRSMLRTLRAVARKHGEDPAAVQLKAWRNHDLRRNVRSGLSSLSGIREEVREAVLAHARPGITGTYDVYSYINEKHDALMQWGTLLRSIVEPAPVVSNVVALRG